LFTIIEFCGACLYDDTTTLAALDRASVLHPFTNLKDFATGKLDSTVVETGKGVRIQDADGKEYIDGFAGLYCVNIGYAALKLLRQLRGRLTSWLTTMRMRGTARRS